MNPNVPVGGLRGRAGEHAYIRHADDVTYVGPCERAHSRWRAFAEFELAN